MRKRGRCTFPASELSYHHGAGPKFPSNSSHFFILPTLNSKSTAKPVKTDTIATPVKSAKATTAKRLPSTLTRPTPGLPELRENASTPNKEV
ncbi:hypothetical protein CANTEDRAFT_115910 [Yamadazyma tenuis ATCC 10573]|uniref:Uncharacterized protein n=1 Tax=Candida tenuis (strain ATCC 10573 / BCRC 21748 / CBS 615 / JCM 9827 / NBRC 10315 / NRRL Y-1498 / VKM Y-70) TaxID=590646 RepID=G3B928_CANTC|nr:uncharacterized protein CANTEDRAFT_115910 [Yamadazyma tenuis ATCC 10573]EGV62448.1 hypothetical protein CANTEDRAFT_115910 [Yamadazyma tenuis ATCC 10573]